MECCRICVCVTRGLLVMDGLRRVFLPSCFSRHNRQRPSSSEPRREVIFAFTVSAEVNSDDGLAALFVNI